MTVSRRMIPAAGCRWRTLAAILAVMTALQSCGIPVPADKTGYIGEWQQGGTWLQITADGTVHYQHRETRVTTTINAPIKAFQGDDFVVGVGPFSTTFHVTRPPFREDGNWKMVVDGVELVRVGPPAITATADDHSNMTRETPMPADLKINYIELPARDLDAVQRFYEATFGWSFTDYGPDYRAFSDEVMDGGFYRADAASTQASGAALVVIYAGNLEGTRDTVLRNGGSMMKEIFAFPGGRRFHFADPNGNELAVWSDH